MDIATRESLIRMYADGAEILASAWEDVPLGARQFQPEPGAWSAHEIICHCADSEVNAATRIRMLALENQPMIVGYDQENWARSLAYHDLDPELALRAVKAVRDWTTPVLIRLTEDQWAASGTHSESGVYSATDWLATYSVHLHDHADQIRANVQAWNARSQQEG